MPTSQLLFSFHGRLNRKPFWLINLALFVAVFVVLVLVVILGGGEALTDFSALGVALLPLFVASIPIIWIGLAVSAKRLHDRNKSAGWLLLFWVVPIFLDRLGQRIDDGLGLVFTLASLAISIWALVELGFLRGTVGPNQYGADPLEARI